MLGEGTWSVDRIGKGTWGWRAWIALECPEDGIVCTTLTIGGSNSQCLVDNVVAKLFVLLTVFGWHLGFPSMHHSHARVPEFQAKIVEQF